MAMPRIAPPGTFVAVPLDVVVPVGAADPVPSAISLGVVPSVKR